MMYSTVTTQSYVSESEVQKTIADALYTETAKPKGNSEKNPLQCSTCGLIISNKWNYTLHMRVHNNDRRYKCDQCSSSFITSHDLKKHKLAHSGIKPRFKCQFCPKTYSSRHSKYLHEDSHNKLEYKCRHCPEIFSKFLERKTHEKEYHIKDGVFFNCSECNKKFTSRTFLENHERNYHKKEEDGFRCHQCGLLFETSVNLNIHRRTHATKTIVINKVDSLGYESKDIKDLKKKNPIELCGVRIHECIICTKRYTSRTEMFTHMSACHPEETKAIFRFSCNHCGKSFKYKQGLKQHLVTHIGEKRFSCSFCDYKSKRSTDLKVHMRNHTGETPYVCEKCGRRFKQIKSFQHHNKQHFGKDFKCDMCDLSFYKSNELEWHRKKHQSGGYQCNKCGKNLANPYSLKNHLKIGKCKEGRKIIKNSNLKTNNSENPIVNLHPNCKRYECFACGFSTLSTLDMTQHERTHNRAVDTDKIINKQIVADFQTKKFGGNRLLKALKDSSEKIDYKGIMSVPKADCSNEEISLFTTLDESIKFSDNLFDASTCSNPNLEELKSNIVSINGKKYFPLNVKYVDEESLTQYLKNMSESFL